MKIDTEKGFIKIELEAAEETVYISADSIVYIGMGYVSKEYPQADGGRCLKIGVGERVPMGIPGTLEELVKLRDFIISKRSTPLLPEPDPVLHQRKP